MRHRAVALAFLFIAAALAPTLAAPTAEAANGDDLVVGGVNVSPGNPCALTGPAGGLAVRNAGASGRIYYASADSPRIGVATSRVTSTAPSACVQVLVPAVTGTAGWDALAFDSARSIIWAARADGSGTVHALSLTGGVLLTAKPAGATRVHGLAVDEGGSRHLFVATGAASLLEVRVTTSPLAVTALGSVALAQPAQGLTPWKGALVTSDAGDWVRVQKRTGEPLSPAFHPGFDYTDPWHQQARFHYFFGAIGVEWEAYAPVGKTALFLGETTTSRVCVSNCPEYECVRHEGSTCLETRCARNCDSTKWVIETRTAPRLRAVDIARSCPGGVPVAPDQTCICPAPAPAPTFTSPERVLHLRGEPTTTALDPPLVVRGAVVVTAAGTSTAHRITLTGPTGTTASLGSASLVADSESLPRGAHAFHARLFDEARACEGGSAQLVVRTENPILVTRAQALRVAGNIPVNLVAESVLAAPADDFQGAESAVVAEPSADAPARAAVVALEAAAAHGPTAATVSLSASASARAATPSSTVDLAALCLALTLQPTCTTLPSVALDADGLASHADVGWSLLRASSGAGASVGIASGRGTAGGAHASAKLPSCPPEAHVAAGAALLPPAGAAQPLPVSCRIDHGPFHAVLGERIVRSGPLFAEASAVALRVTVDAGPFAGEIVVAESHAGITLGGAALLAGPPRGAEAPNDYDTGADSPAAPAAAPLLLPGAHSGSFEGADRADAFRVYVPEGHKVRVALVPAHRAGVALAPAPTGPAADASPRLVRLTLLDPSGAVRDASTLTGAVNRAEVELNADVSGQWGVLLERVDVLRERAPYSLAVNVTTVPLLADDRALGAGDAPSGCSGLADVKPGVVTGALRPGDLADSYRVQVGDGGLVLALAGDLSGADLDLVLLNGSCSVELAVSASGKTPTEPKGTPERIVLPGLAPGAYVARVVRANGVASYALVVGTDPVP